MQEIIAELLKNILDIKDDPQDEKDKKNNQKIASKIFEDLASEKFTSAFLDFKKPTDTNDFYHFVGSDKQIFEMPETSESFSSEIKELIFLKGFKSNESVPPNFTMKFLDKFIYCEKKDKKIKFKFKPFEFE